MVRLRGPGHSPLAFSGTADGEDGLSSEMWTRALDREIGRLRREAAPPLAPAAVTFAGETGSWSLWNALSSRVVGGGGRAGSVSIVVGGRILYLAVSIVAMFIVVVCVPSGRRSIVAHCTLYDK